jgi:exopolysaccharide biosynthesis WecB/TagA/CpsF family protein
VGDELQLNGLSVYSGTQDELLRKISDLCQDDETHLVVTPNVDQIVNLSTSETLRWAFEESSLRVIDGMPLVVLAKVLGVKNPNRNTGADLLPAICSDAHFRNKKIVITGGGETVLAVAASNLQALNPDRKIIGVPFPYLTSAKDPLSQVVIDKLNEARPDIVFICLGSPKQESWFMDWRESLPAAVYIGAGAAVDFASGWTNRAPGWIQSCGFEWLFRLIQDPRRLARRYLVRGPRFIPIAARSIIGSFMDSKP